MKIKNVTLMFLLIGIFAISASAKSVDKATAEIIAKNYFYIAANKFEAPIEFDKISIKDVELKMIGETPIMYVVEFDEGGFVLVSAQKSMPAVLGYSVHKGAKFDMENCPPSYKYFIEELMLAVEYAAINNSEPLESTVNGWATYITNDYESLLTSKDDVQIGPLLDTEWNQDYPYNYYAPLEPDGPGGRCYAGCVGTAMATVMHYFEWPPQGIGSFSYYCAGYGIQEAFFGDSTYNWSAMPLKLTNNSPEESILAAALIQRHTGVSVRMMYGGNSAGGSGAYSDDVPRAMKDYFDYPTTKQTLRQGQTTPNWENLLKQQLDAGYALYHSGRHPTDGGHAWNCDGYQIINGETTFHHNFGWGGYRNGWYTSTNPDGFTSNHGIMENFYPNTANYPVYASGNTVLTTKYGRVNDGSGPIYDYKTGTDASWLISPQKEYDSIVNIDLSWEKFELAEGDYVRVYDGDSEAAEEIGTYTGNTLPESLKSSGNKLFITFKTTGSAPGFVFTYKANRFIYCSGMQQINQRVYSAETNPENKYYNPISMCRWNIVYSGSIGGVLKIHYVDTYDENDYFQVYDHNSGEVHTFYGDVTDEVIELSPAGCMVTFVSDNFNNRGRGAAFTYEDYSIGVENYKVGNLNIYPNPANDKLNIELESDDTFDVTYQIANTIGSVVMRGLYNHNNISNHSIDVSSLNSGIYIISLTTPKGIESRKIVIN